MPIIDISLESRVRDFGLGNMGFVWGYWSMGLSMIFFYGVVGSSMIWVLQVGLTMGLLLS